MSVCVCVWGGGGGGECLFCSTSYHISAVSPGIVSAPPKVLNEIVAALPLQG